MDLPNLCYLDLSTFMHKTVKTYGTDVGAHYLSKSRFKKLKELQSSEKVDRAWSIDGRINFMLSNSTVVHRVVSVFDEVDTILEKVTH